jgi:hypothetical protein
VHLGVDLISVWLLVVVRYGMVVPPYHTTMVVTTVPPLFPEERWIKSTTSRLFYGWGFHSRQSKRGGEQKLGTHTQQTRATRNNILITNNHSTSWVALPHNLDCIVPRLLLLTINFVKIV